LRPMASPFLQVTAVNFAGVLLALALGVSALPYLLGRHLSQPAVSVGDAPRRAAYATLFATLFLLGLAAYAVLARFGIETTIASGIETAAVPASLLEASGRGWVELCGLQSSIASDVAAACAKASGHRGFLRLQDLTFSSDTFAIAAPGIAGLPAGVTMGLSGGLLIAALLTGHAILSGAIVAVSEGHSPGAADPQPFSPPAIALAVLILFAALAIAMLGKLQIAQLLSDGLAIVASGLFPALVLGLYWRRMTASAALAAMLTGFSLATVYITGVRLFPVLLFDWTGAVSNAAPAAARKFADLEAAVAIAASGDLKAAANAALATHAGPLANWWGLKPAGIVLIAAPAGFAAAVVTVIVTSFRPKSSADPA
jgi:cation/acetate symporter